MMGSVNVSGVPADVGIASFVFTLKVFAIYSPYPKAIASGKAFGSVSDIVPVTDICICDCILLKY